MRVLLELLHLARQLDAAGVVAVEGERLVHHGHDLARVKSLRLRTHSALERQCRIGIHVGAADAVFLREVLGGLDHAHRARGVHQGLDQEVLELHRGAQLEAGAVGVGGNRVARHGLGADHQRQLGIAQGNLVGRLAKQLEAGAADALRQDRRHSHRHASIQPDVAGQYVGIEIGLRHRTGDDGIHLHGRQPAALEHGAGHLDSHVGGRHRAQCAAIVHQRRAHAIHQPGVRQPRRKMLHPLSACASR